jgi:hypothetical protein
MRLHLPFAGEALDQPQHGRPQDGGLRCGDARLWFRSVRVWSPRPPSRNLDECDVSLDRFEPGGCRLLPTGPRRLIFNPVTILDGVLIESDRRIVSARPLAVDSLGCPRSPAASSCLRRRHSRPAPDPASRRHAASHVLMDAPAAPLGARRSGRRSTSSAAAFVNEIWTPDRSSVTRCSATKLFSD